MKPSRCDRQACEIVRDFLVGLAVFFAFFTLAMMDSRPSRSAPTVFTKPAATAQSQALSPANVTTGTLILQAPANEGDSSPATRPLRAPLLDTDVNITVTGPIARTIITQKFRNNSGTWVDGIYAYPLPQTAAVDALSIHIGKRIVKGVIKPRAEARQIYRDAINAGMKTSPPSKHRPGVFTSSLTNVAPDEEISIRIEYQEKLQRTNDAYSLRVPLVASPKYALKSSVHVARYNSRAGARRPAPTAIDLRTENINPVSLQIWLDNGFPLDRVTSDTHEIAVTRHGDNSALIAFMRGRIPGDRDFILTWKSKGSAVPGTAIFREELHDGAYVLATLSPPKIEAAPAPLTREVVFIIDTSGSMAGTSLLQVKQSLALALKRLKPGDRFNIIPYNTSFEELFEEPAAVTRESLAIAAQFLSKLRAAGGTKMLPALGAALKDTRKKGHNRIRQVVLLSDGAISNEAELFSLLAAKRGRSRLFMVGIGSASNSFAMRRAAEIGRGSYLHISSASQVFESMNRLYGRLERPVITDLKLEWAPGLRADAWPNPLPDLYAGEPLLIAASISAVKGDLIVTGNISGRPWKQTIALPNAPEGKGIAKFWAQKKIASLEARSYAGQAMSDVNAAIEAVALKHHIVSRMTNLIAVNTTSARSQDQSLASEDLPVNMTAGWVYDPTLDTPGPTLTSATGKLIALLAKNPEQHERQHNPTGRIGKQDKSQKPGAKISKLALNKANQGIGKLPVASVPPELDRTWMIAVMALFFATMSAITLGLWRHLRRSVSPKLRREV